MHFNLTFLFPDATALFRGVANNVVGLTITIFYPMQTDKFQGRLA